MASSGGEVAEGFGDIDVGVELMDERCGAFFHFIEIDGESFGGDVVEAEVFGDREVWALGEFLVDDSDACVEGLVEGAGNQLASVEDDGACVLGVESGEDFAEG